MSPDQNNNTNHRGTQIFACHPTRGRTHVGTVREFTYYKGLTHSGLLRYPVLSVSIGLDELADIEAAGALYFTVELSDAGTAHTISLEAFKQRAQHIDRGYGAQIACPLHAFTRADMKRKVKVKAPAYRNEPQAAQLPMFGRPHHE